MKISFIVIGRNEGTYLKKCLTSVIHAIDEHKLKAEVIYVDSRSTDESVSIAKQFELCRVFVIKGKYNSAIARNIGVKESVGDALIFLDGDMELNSDFVPKIIDQNGYLIYEFVSGNFINYYYNSKREAVKKDYYKKIYSESDTYQPTTGGLFAIKRTLWCEVGGMQPKFKKGQDLDFGYRLAASGHMLLRKKEMMAIHHTVDYETSNRLWLAFVSGRNVYTRAVLYRSHWHNKYVIKRMLTSAPTLLFLCVNLVTSIVCKQPFFLLLYPFVVFAAVFYSMKMQLKMQLVEKSVIQVLRDVQNLLAILFFHPTNRVQYDYEEV